MAFQNPNPSLSLHLDHHFILEQKKILNSDDVWVVVFSSLSTDVNKIKGINREKCDEIFSQLLDVSIQLNSIHVKVWLAHLCT